MNRRILTVDDSPTVQDMIITTLQASGYDVVSAPNGVEALRLLKSDSVDLIISDVNMGQMGGFEFVTKVRECAQFQAVPILFLTTETSGEFKQIGREIGATGWVTKPFEPEELLRVIRRVML